MSTTIKEVTLCYLLRTSRHPDRPGLEVCLAWKEPTPSAVALCLENKRNAYGGKREPDDPSLEHCSQRETHAESGVWVPLDRKRKVAQIVCDNGQRGVRNLTVFTAHVEEADPRPTREMSDPWWFWQQNIPYFAMMDADRFFLPLVFRLKEGEIVTGTIRHSEVMTVIDHDLRIVRLQQ